MTDKTATLFVLWRWLIVAGFFQRAAVRKWRRNNPDWVKAANAKNNPRYYRDHKEQLCARAREYARSNLARRRSLRTEATRRRRQENPNANLRNRLSARIRSALRYRGVRKMTRTSELVGCSLATLRAHLQNCFLPGMSWENRNLWHIDHKKPCSLFDLTRVEEQKKCFHFSNLQPLWAADNLKKGDSFVPQEH